MPARLNQLGIALKALRQLGIGQVGLYARYRLELASGWLTARTRRDVANALDHPLSAFTLYPLLRLPDAQEVRTLLGEAGLEILSAEAGEIVNGSVRLFGGEPVPLDLFKGSSTQHWTAYALGRASYPDQDVKFTWEPARFGWAFTLGRAYLLNSGEKIVATFWDHVLHFLDKNPPNIGPQWVSAQEVALRIIAFTWAAQVFAASPHTTPERLSNLGRAVAAHASRIPATLTYSRAQNNNHLLSEAIGLLTAGMALQDHPQASAWREIGSYWLNRALMEQVSPGGTYVQHSTNYHRLMLHLALWVYGISPAESPVFSSSSLARLSAATTWLLALLDITSGHVPDLGPNDGANILPLTICPCNDFRPVLQAASQAFLDKPALPAGVWDETSRWLGLPARRSKAIRPSALEVDTARQVLHNPASNSWAYLRAAHFTSRPGHADQLHLDLWWQGLNVAVDAGTYLYNASPPWDNSLTHTAVHNTLTVDNQEQMTQAGKFLYLDWAQAKLIQHEKAQDGSWECLSAQHNGYTRLGLIHQRTVTAHNSGSWQIEDELLPASRDQTRSYLLRLHWLVPDWPWQATMLPDGSQQIDLQSPLGRISLQMRITGSSLATPVVDLLVVRAGECLLSHQAVSPTWGWVSPTYGNKQPALSLSLEVSAVPPLTLTSHWDLPSQPNQG